MELKNFLFFLGLVAMIMLQLTGTSAQGISNSTTNGTTASTTTTTTLTNANTTTNSSVTTNTTTSTSNTTTNGTTTVTTAPTTAVYQNTTPSSSTSVFDVVVFDILQDFTSDLSNSSSLGFKNMAANVTNGVTPVFKNAFGDSFFGVNVMNFSKGSIRTTLFAYFDINHPQSIDNIIQALKNASSALNINASSITVTANSPTLRCGFTFSGLALVSILLAATQYVY